MSIQKGLIEILIRNIFFMLKHIFLKKYKLLMYKNIFKINLGEVKRNLDNANVYLGEFLKIILKLFYKKKLLIPLNL